jgi:hypothetical protein
MNWDPDKEGASDLEGGIHLAILKLSVHIIQIIKCCRRIEGLYLDLVAIIVSYVLLYRHPLLPH